MHISSMKRHMDRSNTILSITTIETKETTELCLPKLRHHLRRQSIDFLVEYSELVWIENYQWNSFDDVFMEAINLNEIRCELRSEGCWLDEDVRLAQ